MGDEQPEADQLAVPSIRAERWFKRRRRAILIVLGLLAVAGFLYWFPPWAIKRAEDKSIDCTNAIYRSGTGTASDCEQGGLLAIPKLIPWTRKKALAVESDIHARALEDTIDLAARRDVDRAKAARGVDALIAAVRSNPKLDTVHAVAYTVRAGGAEHALIDHAADLPAAADRSAALLAALHAGDRAAIARIAALPVDDKYRYEYDRVRGALLCLGGDQAGATAALHQSRTSWHSDDNVTTEYAPAELALGACDPGSDAMIDEVWQSRLDFARLVGGQPPPEPLGYEHRYDNEARIQAVLAMDRAGVASLRQYLLVIAPSYGGQLVPPFEILSPWAILTSLPDSSTTPDWADAAAARLIGFADAFVPPKPTKHKRGGDDDDAYRDYDILDEAQADPRPYLRWSAAVIALDAAVGWHHRGEVTKAQASAGVAMACAAHADTAKYDPYAQLMLPSVLELVGRDADALATIDALLARVPDTEAAARGVLAVERAVAQLHAGKVDDAWATIDAAMKLKVDMRIYWNLAWLRAAAGLILGKPFEYNLPDVPDKPEYDFDHPERNLAYWYSAATEPAKAPSRRWHHDGIDPGYYDNWGVLPAQLLVVGKAAGQGDVELWLDVVTAKEIMPFEALASARAEAARWRGDTAAAEAWDKRLAAFRSMATDDRSAYLIRMALER